MKNWKILLVMGLVLATIFVLASCGACEHTYEETITTEATCMAEGVKTFACSQCGDSYTEAMPKTDHSYSSVPTKPTCTEGGYMTFTCKYCKDSYTEELDPAAGHSYVATVTTPTCTADGYTTNTCEVCGDSNVSDTVPATGVHVLATSVAALTDEQKASNPKAIGMESVACVHCDYEEVTDNAIYVYMDFTALPDFKSYEGSDSYKAIPDNYRLNPDVGPGLAYIDMQENLRAINFGGNGGTGFYLKGDGKLSLAKATAYIIDDLYLISAKKSALKTFTISFDITPGHKPEAEETEGNVDCRKDIFFALGDPKSNYNTRAAALVLDKTSMSDDGMEYELRVQQYSHSSTANMGNEATGFFMNIEKEYSFKLDFDYTAGAFVTIYVKEAGSSEEYQNIGSYELNVNHSASEYGYLFMQGSKNVVDNFKITAPLGAERVD